MDETRQPQLNEEVVLALSGEKGRVSGIAAYADGSKHVQVTWVDGHGCQRKDWWQPQEVRIAS